MLKRKYDLSKIMRRAWEFVRSAKMNISSALKRAWKEAKEMAEEAKNGRFQKIPDSGRGARRAVFEMAAGIQAENGIDFLIIDATAPFRAIRRSGIRWKEKFYKCAKDRIVPFVCFRYN